MGLFTVLIFFQVVYSPMVLPSFRTTSFGLVGVLPDTITDLTWNPSTLHKSGLTIFEDKSILWWNRWVLAGVNWDWRRIVKVSFPSRVNLDDMKVTLMVGLNVPIGSGIGLLYNKRIVKHYDYFTISDHNIYTSTEFDGLRIGTKMWEWDLVGSIGEELYKHYVRRRIGTFLKRETSERAFVGFELRKQRPADIYWISLRGEGSSSESRNYSDDLFPSEILRKKKHTFSAIAEGAWVRVKHADRVTFYVGFSASLEIGRVCLSENIDNDTVRISMEGCDHPWSFAFRLPLGTEIRTDWGTVILSAYSQSLLAHRVHEGMEETFYKTTTDFSYQFPALVDVIYSYTFRNRLRLSIRGKLAPNLFNTLHFMLTYWFS